MLELLPIMLIFVDLLARAVLFLIQLLLFALGQVTIVGGHVGFFLVVNVLFFILDARSLSRRHGAVLHSIRDAILLILLAGIHFVDARMTRIHLPRSRAGRVAILGLSSGGADKHQTAHCQD